MKQQLVGLAQNLPDLWVPPGLPACGCGAVTEAARVRVLDDGRTGSTGTTNGNTSPWWLYLIVRKKDARNRISFRLRGAPEELFSAYLAVRVLLRPYFFKTDMNFCNISWPWISPQSYLNCNVLLRRWSAAWKTLWVQHLCTAGSYSTSSWQQLKVMLAISTFCSWFLWDTSPCFTHWILLLSCTCLGSSSGLQNLMPWFVTVINGSTLWPPENSWVWLSCDSSMVVGVDLLWPSPIKQFHAELAFFAHCSSIFE